MVLQVIDSEKLTFINNFFFTENIFGFYDKCMKVIYLYYQKYLYSEKYHYQYITLACIF